MAATAAAQPPPADARYCFGREWDFDFALGRSGMILIFTIDMQPYFVEQLHKRVQMQQCRTTSTILDSG